MRIFLDGCDGTGKSTVAKYLAQRFGLDIFCLTKDSEKSYARYDELLSIENVVYDRTFLSEVVYPKVFGRDEWMAQRTLEELIDNYKCNGVFVICTAPEEIIRRRLRKRNSLEYQEVYDNLAYINKSFKSIARENGLLVVDTYAMSLSQIGNEIERRMKENGEH